MADFKPDSLIPLTVPGLNYQITRDLHFLDEKEGILIRSSRDGDQAHYGIFHTSDGGENWAEVFSHTSFTTEYSPPLIIPTEQGKLWVSIMNSPTTQGFFIFSEDNGLNWDTLDGTGILVSRLLGISPEGKMFGLGAMDSLLWSGLLISEDGGQTWTREKQSFYYSLSQKVYFFNEQVLAYQGGTLSPGPNISLDGGKTWKTVFVASNPHYKGLTLSAKCGDKFWIGNEYSLSLSKDGGQNWKYNANPGEFYFSEMAFGNQMTGFASSFSDIFYTRNGGKNFHILAENQLQNGLWGYYPCIKISYPAEDVAFFCSEHGLMKWER